MCYDHDTHGAGFALVEGAQTVMSVEAFTTPKPDTDLDDFIRDMGTDAVAAWEAVKALVASRTRYLRVYSGTGEEFLRGKTFIPKRLAEAIMEREHFKYAGALLWVYRDGVYAPTGEDTVRTHAQALLGEERREHCLEETLRYIEVALRTDDPIPDARSINLRNGRLDWRTRTLEPHAPTHFETVQLPVEYDAAAQCPAFDTYLTTTLDADVIPLVEEIMGYCLIADTRFEKAVMLTGEGENGKSVFLDTLAALLGTDNVSNVALQDLEENRFRVAELYGKLANTFADLDARALRSSSMFKTLVTGDAITAERKFKDPFTFRSYARLLFSANRVPPSHDRTRAFYRRWLIIPFEHTFTGTQADKSLRAKLCAELPGIFNRAVDGVHRLFTQEAFTEPLAVQEALKAYVRSNDNVRVFVDECVDVIAGQHISKKEFYAVYGVWCDQNGEQAISQKALKDALTQAVPTVREGRPTVREGRPTAKGLRSWEGLQWNGHAPPPPP
jgi:putative DNA primase/helicase